MSIMTAAPPVPGPFTAWAERLIELGYGPLPIIPGTKKPGVWYAKQWLGSKWPERYAKGRPTKDIIARWGLNNTGIGVLCGLNGLVAIDIDTDDPAIREAIENVLILLSPVSKRGKRGETFFHYGPGIASHTWKIHGNVVVEVMADGRQSILPPTIHANTAQPYVWTGPDTLLDYEPEDLPRLPDDIAERISAALKPFGYRSDPPLRVVDGSKAGGGADTPHRELNDMALANLAAWVPALNLYRCQPARGGYEAVPIWRRSGNGRPDEQRDLSLSINPAGIKDCGIDTALDLVMAADGCDLDTAFKFLAERLGYGEIDVSGLIPEEAPAIEPGRETTIAAEPKPPEPEKGVEPPLMQYTRNVPGVVGQIIDWTVATARRPNRMVALGTAITVTGTLIGRRVAGPTRSATHLYVVAIGDTGHGKQHGINTATKLMHAAGASSHLGAGEYFSLSGVFSMLWDSPLTLCLQDEFGRFLQGVTDPNNKSWEKSVSRVLRTLWGTSFGILPGVQWAKEKKKAIWAPSLSIFGFSTPDEFSAALQGDSITNGFVNRLLMLELGVRHPEIDPAVDPDIVPSRLVDGLKALYTWSGPESLVRIDEPDLPEIKPDILPWADSQAHACYKDFSRFIDSEGDKRPHIKDFISRCAETAVRLATIRAAGRWGRGAAVDTSDVEWGKGFVWTAAQALAAQIQDYEPESDRKKSINRIGNWTRRKYPELGRPISWTEIRRYEGGNVKSSELKDRIEHMVAVGMLKREGAGYVPGD